MLISETSLMWVRNLDLIAIIDRTDEIDVYRISTFKVLNVVVKPLYCY